jgi:phosphohistidine phosphatase
MNIYLLRHGIAAEKGKDHPDDSLRPLVPAGVKETLAVAKGMKRLGIRPDLVLSSSFTRARETAAIVAKVLGVLKKLEYSDHLTPDGSFSGLVQDLQSREGIEDILLVGHEPFLGCLIGYWTLGRKEAFVSLKKSGLCRLETESIRNGRCAVLKWLMTPGQLKGIARH